MKLHVEYFHVFGDLTYTCTFMYMETPPQINIYTDIGRKRGKHKGRETWNDAQKTPHESLEVEKEEETFYFTSYIFLLFKFSIMVKEKNQPHIIAQHAAEE